MYVRVLCLFVVSFGHRMAWKFMSEMLKMNRQTVPKNSYLPIAE